MYFTNWWISVRKLTWIFKRTRYLSTTSLTISAITTITTLCECIIRIRNASREHRKRLYAVSFVFFISSSVNTKELLWLQIFADLQIIICQALLHIKPARITLNFLTLNGELVVFIPNLWNWLNPAVSPYLYISIKAMFRCFLIK